MALRIPRRRCGGFEKRDAPSAYVLASVFNVYGRLRDGGENTGGEHISSMSFRNAFNCASLSSNCLVISSSEDE